MTVSSSEIAAYLGIEEKQIAARRDIGGEIVVLVDEGIGGIKKHTIPLSELQFQTFESEETAVIESDTISLGFGESSTVTDGSTAVSVDYTTMTVAELQDLARKQGVSYAGLRKAELIEVLEANE